MRTSAKFALVLAFLFAIGAAIFAATRPTGASVSEVQAAVQDGVNPIQVTVDDISTELPAVKAAANTASAKIDQLAAALPQMISDTVQAQTLVGAMPSMPSNPFGLTITTSTSLLTTTVGVPVQVVAKPSAVAFAGQLTGYYMWTAAGEGGKPHEPQLHSFENRDVVAGDSIVQVWNAAGTYNVDALLHTALGESAADIQITVLPDPCDAPSGEMTPAQLQECMLKVGMSATDPAAVAQAMTTGFSNPAVYAASGITSTQVPTVFDVWTIAGVPAAVDAATVDYAKGVFKSTLPGAGHILAEPGKLNVGPEFPESKLLAAKGAIQRWNAVNQTVFENEGPSFFNCPEGGFLLASANHVDVDFGKIQVHLPGWNDRNWLLVVRCKNADDTTPNDFNTQTRFTNYVAGHIMVARYSESPGGGFVSEEHMMQIVQTALHGGTNCGSTGCEETVKVDQASGVSLFLLDENTGAYSVLHKTSDSDPWTLEKSNWQ